MELNTRPAPDGVDVGVRLAVASHVWAPVLPRDMRDMEPDAALPPPFSSFGSATAWKLVKCDAMHDGACDAYTLDRAAAEAVVIPRLIAAVPTVFGITENKRVAAAARNAKKGPAKPKLKAAVPKALASKLAKTAVDSDSESGSEAVSGSESDSASSRSASDSESDSDDAGGDAEDAAAGSDSDDSESGAEE